MQAAGNSWRQFHTGVQLSVDWICSLKETRGAGGAATTSFFTVQRIIPPLRSSKQWKLELLHRCFYFSSWSFSKVMKCLQVLSLPSCVQSFESSVRFPTAKPTFYNIELLLGRTVQILSVFFAIINSLLIWPFNCPLRKS